jgi:hypothetical protein
LPSTAIFHRLDNPEKRKMFNYTSASTERKPLLPLHEPLPAYSTIVAPQLNQAEGPSMPSNTSASMEDSEALPLHYDEKLPLYAPSSESPALQLPADTATASKVREFLHLLLTTKRDVTAAQADKIVDHWDNINNGYELRCYSKSQFQTIFGPGVGRVLWDDVDSCLKNDQMRAKRYLSNDKNLMKSQYYPAGFPSVP